MPQTTPTTNDTLLDRALVTAFLANVPDCVYFKDRESRFIALSSSLADKHGQQGQGVGAVVSPSPPAGEKVVVKYFKRKNGQWVLLGKHRPKLNSQGVAETAFYPKVKHGTCKLTGRYPGDNKYDASKRKMVYDCATGEPKS